MSWIELKREWGKRPETSRLIRYAVVGIGSYLVGFLVFNGFYAATGKLVFSSTMSYALSVVNGFVLNRQWTFRDRRQQSLHRQATKFAFVNMVGYCVNLLTYSCILALAGSYEGGSFHAGQFVQNVSIILHGHAPHYGFLLVNGAGLIATGIVIVINYLASRFWSFR